MQLTEDVLRIFGMGKVFKVLALIEFFDVVRVLRKPSNVY